MKLGLNLSFATKRWLEPEFLAEKIRSDLQTEDIQFTWDLIDPWWPGMIRDRLAAQWGRALRSQGLNLLGTFSGLAAYTYPQLLAPTAEMRAVSLEFFKRAVDMTAAMGTDCIGTALGGMSYGDAHDPKRRAERYASVLDLVRELAAYAGQAGMAKIIIEPTPVFAELPGTPADCFALMQDLEGTTDVPVKLLIDWGHALMKPFLQEQADIDVWLRECGNFIDSFHLQQTDGQLDRHWSFTQAGIVQIPALKAALKRHNAGSIPHFVEIIYPFEASDEEVWNDVKATMSFLRNEIGQS